MTLFCIWYPSHTDGVFQFLGEVVVAKINDFKAHMPSLVSHLKHAPICE